MKHQILIVDDDSERLQDLTGFLESADFIVNAAAPDDFNRINTPGAPDLIVAYQCSENAAAQSSREFRARWRAAPILLLGCLPETDAAVAAEIAAGATAYLQTPFQKINLAMLAARLIERAEMEEVIRKKDFRFLSLIENSTDLITLLSLDGTILYESPSANHILGREPQTYKNVNAFDFIHPEDRRRVVAYLKQAVANPPPSAFVEYRYRHQNDSWCHLESVGRLIRDAERETILVVNSRDVTARVRSELALRESEEKFRAQYKNNPIATYTWQKAGDDFVFNDYNDAAERAVGGKIKELSGTKASEIHARTPLIAEHIRRCFDEQTTINDEFPHTYSTTGETRNLECSFVYVPPDLVMMHARDITEPKLAERENRSLNTEIQTQRQRLDAIIANVPGVVWEVKLKPDAADGAVDFVSDYVEKMTGYTVEEWRGAPDFWLRIMHPDDRAHARLEIRALIENGGKVVQRYRWLAKDGKVVWVETQIVLVNGENGAPDSLRCISIDVSERKTIEEALQKSEEQLRQSQKLESVGRLAGGIAHDFNNMLTAINGYSDLLLRELNDEQDSLRRKVIEIKKAGERSASLTQQLLAFSRRQVLQPKLIDLNRIVGDMNQLLIRLIGEDIQLNIQLDAKPNWVEADPGQLSQVIMNLVVNARDAMPKGGELTVQIDSVSLEDEPVAQFASGTRGKFVRLCVKDNGVGIDAKILGKIFEPFFTTKQTDVGTGLGLATVYGIVKQSGGFIWVESEPGAGAEFKIYLPFAEVKARPKKEKKIFDQFPHGTETILLVEDEEMVRSLTRRILEVCGYTVIEARNGVEALKICEETKEAIDLLMTDVVMPQLNGRELSEKITARRPRIRTLFNSGYMTDRLTRLGVSSDEINFIQKPFAPDALARKVREILDSK